MKINEAESVERKGVTCDFRVGMETEMGLKAKRRQTGSL